MADPQYKRVLLKVSGEVLKVRAAAQPRWYRVSDRAGNWSAWKPVRPAR